MNFQNMQLTVSAPDKEFWPENELPEIVLAGRSNVGKSSLINTLCGNGKMAYVGNTPGKTRLLNFFNVNDEMMLVDVPGYGFANASKNLLIQFGKMMEDYFAERKHIKGVIVLLDCRHKPTEDDMAMVEFARYHEYPIVYVVTKADKCGVNELNRNLTRIAECMETDVQELILFSSKTKKGKDKLISKIESLIEN